jgi:hypothetical protein
MFLEPDPDEPIKDLILGGENDADDAHLSLTPEEFNRHIREAYRRGKEERTAPVIPAQTKESQKARVERMIYGEPDGGMVGR